MACGQAAALNRLLGFVLIPKVADPLGFAACRMVSVLTFLLIVIPLSRLWGNARKALAMILLAIAMAPWRGSVRWS
jgi:hypothetical protein